MSFQRTEIDLSLSLYLAAVLAGAGWKNGAREGVLTGQDVAFL